MVTEILSDIKTKEERNEFIGILYEECFASVARFVKMMNGSFEDAKDVFHDALVVFYEKITEDKLNISVSHKAYLLGIAKHLWLRRYRENCDKVGFSELEAEISIPEDYYCEKKETIGLLQLVEHSGKKCMELLRSFYYDRLSLRNISQVFGYATERSATVQKYKCLEKIRNRIKENNISYEDFID